MNNRKQRDIKLCMWEPRSFVFSVCVCVYFFSTTCMSLPVSMHSYFLFWFYIEVYFCLNEMHLDIYNFILPCNNISLCDGMQAERGHTGRRAFVWTTFDITPEWKTTSRWSGLHFFLRNTDELKWMLGLLLWNPGAPVSKGTPLAPQPSSLVASVSWHQGHQAPLTGLWSWRNPFHSRSSATTGGSWGINVFADL